MQSSPRIDELRQKFHENPRRYFAPLANEYRKAGDPEQAIAICRAHLAQQPAHMSGHVVYGQALYDARRVEEARGVFEKALALDPDNSIVLKQLGDMARQRGDSPEAQHWYKRALDADPHAPDVAAYVEELRDVEMGAADVEPAAVPAVSGSDAGESADEPIDEQSVADAPAVMAEADPQTDEQGIEAQEPEAQQSVDGVGERLTEEQAAESAAEEKPATEQLMDGHSPAAEPPAVELSPDELPASEPLTVNEDAEHSPADELSPADEHPVEERRTNEQSVIERIAAQQQTGEDGNAEDASESMPVIDFDIAEQPIGELDPVESASSQSFDELSLDESLHLIGDESPKADMEIAVAGPMDQSVSVTAAPGSADAAVTDVRKRTPAREEFPFVTRTMGELYAQQGYHAAALEVFHQLAIQNPDDSAIAERIEEITLLGSRRTPPKPRADEMQDTGASTPDTGSDEPTPVMSTGDPGEGSMDDPEDRPDPGSASIIDWDEPSSIYSPPASDVKLSPDSMDAGAVERHFSEMEIGDGDAWDTDPWAAGFSPEDRSAFSYTPADQTAVDEPSGEQTPEDNLPVVHTQFVDAISEAESTDTTSDDTALVSMTSADDASAGESPGDEEGAFTAGDSTVASPADTHIATDAVPEPEDAASLVAYSPSAPSDDELTRGAIRAPSVREFFATLGSRRAPLHERAGPVATPSRASRTASSSQTGSSLSDAPPETTFPLATDAFANLFPDAFVAESDTRAAFVLSGAVSSVPPERATPTGPLETKRSDQASGAPASGESEEDIRRFREWLDGLSES